MAEAGVPESTMKAIMGHLSARMLERYSHIRMKAKREAILAVEAQTAEARRQAVGTHVKQSHNSPIPPVRKRCNERPKSFFFAVSGA
jgi:hypothetical protein